MNIDLKNKVVLITGSTDGLGYKLAQGLVALGAQVIVHGRSNEKVNKAVETLGALKGIVCDLNNPLQITSQFNKIDHIDILVNNAGVWLEGKTRDAGPEKIQELIKVNLTAPLVLTSFLLPKLEASSFGQIVNVSSIAGVEIPSGYYHTIYSATKFGLQAFSEAMAKEYENKNVRVMGFYPGGMETGLFEKAGMNYQKHEPWMFDPQESVEAIIFMLTRSPKTNVKRLDLINHQQI